MQSTSFKDQWKMYMKQQGSMKKASSTSYEYWRKKYVSGILLEGERPQEKFTDGRMIAGKIYTFFYMGKEKINEKTQFVDHWPLFFSFGQITKNGKVYEIGIDLNLIPFQLRVFILDKLYAQFQSTIKQNENDILAGKKGKKAIRIDYKLALVLLKGTGWERAYLSLMPESISKTKVVDYRDWVTMIPLYTKGIRGMSIAKIYNMYLQNMNKPSDVAKTIRK